MCSRYEVAAERRHRIRVVDGVADVTEIPDPNPNEPSVSDDAPAQEQSDPPAQVAAGTPEADDDFEVGALGMLAAGYSSAPPAASPAKPEPSAPPAGEVPAVEPAPELEAEPEPSSEAAPAVPVDVPAVDVSNLPVAADTDEAGETGPVEATGQPRVVVAAALAVVLAMAACAALAVAAFRNSSDVDSGSGGQSQNPVAGQAALAAAKQETAATLTYDYRTLDRDFATAQKGLTSSFAQSYLQTADSSVKPLATKTHAVSTATIAAAGVISATAGSAQILVYADQTVQNKLLKTTSRLDRSVIEVSMVLQNGKWLVSGLSPF